LESPGNTALRASVPVDKAVVVSVATPPDSVPVPSKVAPLKNLTDSPFVVVVGGPTAKGDRTEVNVTDWPVKMDELGEVVRVSEVSTGAAVSCTVLETLPTKTESPEYLASTLWTPLPSGKTPMLVRAEALDACTTTLSETAASGCLASVPIRSALPSLLKSPALTA